MNRLDWPADDVTTAQEALLRARQVQARRVEMLRPRPEIKEAAPPPPPPPEPPPKPAIVAPVVPVTLIQEPPIDLPHSPFLNDIFRATADYFQLSMAEFMSRRRQARLTLPRQIAMYLAKVMTVRSFPEIAGKLGGRDHTTILHGVRKIELLIAIEDQRVIKAIAEIKEKLSS